MMNPIRLVNDIFDDRELSDSSLRSFTEDFLTRLAQPDNNPGGMYNTLITNVTTKYNAYYGRITNEATLKAIAEGTTITRNNARKAAEDKISQLQGLIKFVFGENSAVYQEFYPLGMSEYYQAREGDVGILFDRFVASATTHLSVGYPAEVAAITTLVNSFDTAYTARQAAIAQVDSVGTGKREDRKNLTLELTTAFLTIAIQNLGNPDKYDDYFDPRYLPLNQGPRVYNGIVNNMGVVNAVPAGVITKSKRILLKNTGPVDLIFSLSNQAGVIHPEHQIVIPGGEQQRLDGNLPILTEYYLNIQNTNPTENGQWHVEVDD